MQAIPTEEQPLSMAQPQQIPSRPKRKRSDRLPHQSISQLIRNTKDWEVLETSAEGRTVKRSRGLGTKKKSGLFARLVIFRLVLSMDDPY